MRDPDKNVTFVFRCYEKESADLKIRLRYDGLKQSEFFRSLLKMYIANDPTILPVVQRIKETQNTMGRKKITNTRKEHEQGIKMLEELGITKTDRNDIFDMIVSSEEEYE